MGQAMGDPRRAVTPAAMADQLEALQAEMIAGQAAAWYNAPLPRRWHRCRPHNTGIVSGRLVERCACGGIRLGGPPRPWLERNQRRRDGER
jgi:hypothetical protein